MTAEITCIFRMNAQCGESPVWSVKEKVLYWVDIPSCLLHRFDPRTGQNTSHKLPQPIGALALRKKGGMILALAGAIALFDPRTQALDIIASPEKHLPENRFNDAKCDSQGRFWCGTMNKITMASPSGSLYRVDRNHQVTCMQKDVALSNGLDWSLDGLTMYYTESFRHTIFAYDFSPDTGEISNRRIFVKMDPSDGEPDGLTVDAEGYIWSARYGKGKLVRYTPQGEIDRIVSLPVPNVTSCVFGGEDLDTLFITTARSEKDPLSGGLFAFTPGVRGLCANEYVD